TTSLQVDKARYVASGDFEAKCVTLDRCAIEELRVRPHRGHRGHLIDDDRRRRRIAQHREQCNRRVVAATLVDGGFASFGDGIEDDIRADRLLAVDLEPAVAICSCLGELPGVSGTCGPKGNGGICERTVTCLNLPFDANGG